MVALKVLWLFVLLACSGGAVEKCERTEDCGPGEICRLQGGGDRCCWPRTCPSPCLATEICVKTVPPCDAAGPCACPPQYACQPRQPTAPALPASACQPACENGTMCRLQPQGEGVEGSYSCQDPVPGCWVWWDCTLIPDLIGTPAVEEEEALTEPEEAEAALTEPEEAEAALTQPDVEIQLDQ